FMTSIFFTDYSLQSENVPWFSFPLSALSVVGQQLPSSPHGCMEGSCYPATGNLLIGRAINLTATSTCGLHGPEHYCIVSHLQDSDKCFSCDSRQPYNPYYHRHSHRVENVIQLKDRNEDFTWWQSVNGVCGVSIKLNLEAEFHFTHLIMKFKTFRPAAMLIERSSDFGHSWRPYRYFAYNCTRTFPRIPAHALHLINDVICEERYSDIEPSTEGEVIYKVLDPAIHVRDPYSLEIQELLRITNLRINFTKLHTLGDNLLDRRSDVLQKYYYALYELVVRGSCFCYGHASECAPVPGVEARDSGMIHGRCVCKHNTEGLNCEHCRDFHHDMPWSPAQPDNPHTCRECNCNGHSSECHFDMAVYLATGNTSGGVCDDCLHNTMGRNCEMCKPFYYQDPSRDIRDPGVCTACDCDPVGSMEGGVCDSHTDLDMGMIGGQCRCKPNVKGARCDDCKEGFYGLSQNDPQGCQPCNCDPRGIIMLGTPCDQISGDCSCKRYVTGRYCNQCLPEYWGLSNDLAGCRACTCDFGGAYNNRCTVENGQCECRSHLIGRQCSDVQPGYFCAALDYYKYEAEDAIPFDVLMPDVRSVHRQRSQGHTVTWTGPGFARVKDGAGLVFSIDNIPYAMEYDIIIRYEPEVHFTVQEVPCLPQCIIHQVLHRTLYTDQYVKMPRPFCFEPSNRYVVAIRFQRHGVSQRHLTAFILVDSLVLTPIYTELPGFQGNDPAAEEHRDEMVRYMCMDSFMATPMPLLAEMCTKLICSISAILHEGALQCQCDPQGSLSAECDRIGGQCHCKPNVIGRRCDQCAPGTYGFGQYGCTACDCHSQGSVGHQCDPGTGQCPCRQGASGRQCSDCQPGQWGFPSCRQCECNGHADHCHPQTGQCQSCRDYTDGPLCDRCVNGFFGNPVLGSGDHCRPCPCPGNPGSGHSHGDSCQADHASNQILCNCNPGYKGNRCDLCAPGYYGNPEHPGGQCRPCQCSGNIDTEDPGSCDPRTGQCLRCLYNTDGSSCSNCKHGYYGNALVQDCRRCTCVTAGTQQSYCSGGHCHCDSQTGACPCRDNVVGDNCDQCAPEHWNFGTDTGCERCGCHPQHATGPHCNMFSGQCHCRQGFGGRQCTECEQFHWGDPRVQCEECNCHPLGSESAQCDRVTGACECRTGASGLRCDSCDRGFSGAFPKCIPCHPCFELWDDTVCTIRQELERIRREVQRILESGEIPGVEDRRIHELEEKLARLRDLIQDGDKDRIHQLIGQSIDDLSANSSSNGTCPNSPCGGAGCRDSDGQRVCGGDGCNGTVSASLKGLKYADDVTNNLTAASDDLQRVTKKLQDIAMLTQDVKNQAMDTLDKAQKKKDLFENSNKKLKEFIKKIKEFLTVEGADPESIEKVALQVLAISLPVNRTTLDSVVQQIKDSINNLTDIEGVFNNTAEQLRQAKELLNRAKDVKTRAEGVKDTANMTKQALDSSEMAIQKAAEALDQALKNLNSTKNSTAMVEEKLKDLEAMQMDSMMRLANLSRGIDELKSKTDQNREMAQDATNQAQNATLEALGLEEVCVCVCVYVCA
uniref:Laminin, beta 2-like n=1 Tax=Esox lucius TaxID=8010 RepID=A0AAY5KX69_ESOLU